ncbi:MAG: anti-sigma factor family protein [Caulobacteraceae bacterium]
MSACPDKEALLHGLLDGELDAANAQAFETHLKTCPGCAAAFNELQGLKARISAPGIAHRAPDSLRARIEAMAAPAPEPRRPLRRAAPWALSGGFAAIAATLAVMLVQPSLVGLAVPGAAVAGLEDELVASHVRSTLAEHLVDVQTSDRHVVKPWFNGRVDFAPPVIDLIDQGYPLVGGRLDYIDHRVVAALVFHRNRHVVNLFIWPSKGEGREPDAAARGGYSVVHWTARGLEFWAVSDIEAKDLKNFEQAFQTHAPS